MKGCVDVGLCLFHVDSPRLRVQAYHADIPKGVLEKHTLYIFAHGSMCIAKENKKLTKAVLDYRVGLETLA